MPYYERGGMHSIIWGGMHSESDGVMTRILLGKLSYDIGGGYLGH
jgi:hypothetical protein